MAGVLSGHLFPLGTKSRLSYGTATCFHVLVIIYCHMRRHNSHESQWLKTMIDLALDSVSWEFRLCSPGRFFWTLLEAIVHL